LISLLVVVVLLLVSLAAMALVLFVIAPAHVQAQQNQTTIKTLEGLNADSLDIQNTPAKKVHVGDIDVAYKTFGKGDPILLIPGASDGLNRWDPTMIKTLSSNHTVIVFDSRGLGNTTTGSKPYTYQQLANDSADLLDALKIPKADVLGYSLGSYIAQQLAIMFPDKVNSLVLVG
jgi:alpha-beta hydrolase superfamily lysophospholipase